MDTFQPPPPLLPDLIPTPANIPPPNCHMSMSSPYQSPPVTSGHNSVASANDTISSNALPLTTNSMLANDDSVVQMFMDCSMSADSDMTLLTPTNQSTHWTATSASSNSFLSADYQHQNYLLPPPPSPSYQANAHQLAMHQHQQQQQQNLPEMQPAELIAEFEKIMCGDDDPVVLANSVCLLFRYSVHNDSYSREVCKLLSTSRVILNSIFKVLRDDKFPEDDGLICYATGNLTNISKYDEGRAAIIGIYGSMENYQRSNQSLGVESLIKSLRSRDSNVVIFATTALHNLLLERRLDLQELAKKQIKHGLKHIIALLDNPSLKHNYEFKVIVLDCLQILAYGNPETRLLINENNGPFILLRTIKESIDHHLAEELIETALRVLKSLSTCCANKEAIIKNGGIDILFECIRGDNKEVLKICLWTIRNLSDLLSDNRKHIECLNQLAQRVLDIIKNFVNEPCIITCALGIFANLTCNNESIKKFACESSGIDYLINTIQWACKNDRRDFRIVDKEILEPAVCALCHLTNLDHQESAKQARSVVRGYHALFRELKSSKDISEALSKAIDKLLRNLGEVKGEEYGMTIIRSQGFY